jgi:hypothetical protein
MNLSENCQRNYTPGIGCVEATLYLNGMTAGTETYVGGELISQNIFYTSVDQIPALNQILSAWDGSVLGEYSDEYIAQNPNAFDVWEGQLLNKEEDNHPFPAYLKNASEKEANDLLLLRSSNFELFVIMMNGLTTPAPFVFIYENHSPKEARRRRRKK